MRIENAIKTLILALAISLAGTGPGECSASTPPLNAERDYTGSVNADGLVRTFLVHVPPNLPASPALMVVFHGGGGTSLSMANKTHMNQVADTGNFIAVYPQGVRGQWNFGPQSRSSANDVGFVRKMLNHLTERFNIDQRRIYMAGFSAGGHMTERLAYEMPDKIAAASMVCANGLVGLMQTYGPRHPSLPVVIMLGTQDPHDPFAGGLTAILNVPVLSGPATVESWASSDGCGAPVDAWLPNTCTTDDSRGELKYYRGACNNDVAFYKIWNGGHAWPGSSVAPQTKDVGNVNEDFSASQTIWDFSSVHRKGW